MEKHIGLAWAKAKNKVLLGAYLSVVTAVLAAWIGWLEATNLRALEARAGQLEAERARAQEETAFLRAESTRVAMLRPTHVAREDND